jgi:hypothetical protein
MAHADLTAVLALPAKEQRRLLTDGDPAERLWAAWALALRLGADAVPLLRDGDGLRAPSGLRRQVLVVMAGLGEREVLRTVAEADAVPEVRATACALFLRTAVDGDAEALAFAERQMSSPIGEVREAVLLEHEAGRVRLPEDALFRALRDPPLDIRSVAVRCIGRATPLPEASTKALVDAMKDERDLDHRRALFRELPRSSYVAILHALRDAPTRDLTFVLELMRACRTALDWTEVSVLAARLEPEVLLLVLRLLRHPVEHQAFPWLAELVARMTAEGWPQRSHAAGVAWDLARSYVMAQLSPGTAALLDSATVEILRHALEDELEYLQIWLLEEPEERERILEEIAAQRRRLDLLR